MHSAVSVKPFSIEPKRHSHLLRFLFLAAVMRSHRVSSFVSSLASSPQVLWGNKGIRCHHCDGPSSTRQTRHDMNKSANEDSTRGVGGVVSDVTSLSNNDIYRRKQEQLLSASRLSLAPMMDYTDRHFRYFMRLLTPKTLLYSEMIAANAIAHEHKSVLSGINTDRDEIYPDWQLRRYLAQSLTYSDSHDPLGETPSVLQLGGSDPSQLHAASSVIHNADYCEYTALNLNCGCPSPKVANKGCFGAALMGDPGLVKDLTTAMYDGAEGALPVTVKCRIGTDTTSDSSDDAMYGELCRFVDTVASGGVVTDFQIHARIAILTKKLSPAKNRSVPPLRYDVVRRLVEDFPELTFSLNGGIENLFQAREEMEKCPDLAGIMVGRSMAAQPWHWAMADTVLYPTDAPPSSPTPNISNRWEVLRQFGIHADREEAVWGTKIRRLMLKALDSLFHGEPNAKRFRIALEDIGGLPKKLMMNGSISEEKAMADQPPVSELILQAAVDSLSEDVLYRTKEDSFDLARIDWDKQCARNNLGDAGDGMNTRSSAVREWQTNRKEEEAERASIG